MAEKKHEPVTLVKDGRKVTTSLPREIVQYKAAGWREEPAPEADSPQDVTVPPAEQEPALQEPAVQPSQDAERAPAAAPAPAEAPALSDNPRPAATKGGIKK